MSKVNMSPFLFNFNKTYFEILLEMTLPSSSNIIWVPVPTTNYQTLIKFCFKPSTKATRLIVNFPFLIFPYPLIVKLLSFQNFPTPALARFLKSRRHSFIPVMWCEQPLSIYQFSSYFSSHNTCNHLEIFGYPSLFVSIDISVNNSVKHGIIYPVSNVVFNSLTKLDSLLRDGQTYSLNIDESIFNFSFSTLLLGIMGWTIGFDRLLFYGFDNISCDEVLPCDDSHK